MNRIHKHIQYQQQRNPLAETIILCYGLGGRLLFEHNRQQVQLRNQLQHNLRKEIRRYENQQVKGYLLLPDPVPVAGTIP